MLPIGQQPQKISPNRSPALSLQIQKNIGPCTCPGTTATPVLNTFE